MEAQSEELSGTIAEEGQQRTEHEIDSGADRQGGRIGHHAAAEAGDALRRKDSRGQDPSQQVKARREDRMRLVSMPTEKDI